MSYLRSKTQILAFVLYYKRAICCNNSQDSNTNQDTILQSNEISNKNARTSQESMNEN